MANLFAVREAEEGLLAALEVKLRESNEFDEVWRPAPGWVAAQSMLPESEPDPPELRERGFAFAEGRDRLERSRDRSWIDRLVDLTERDPRRLSELPGDFGFLRFRPDGSVLVVRSCAGLVPFYLERGSRRIALSTLHSYFPRFLPGTYRVDPLMTSCWAFAVHFIDSRTFIEGVSILPSGSSSEVSLGSLPRIRRYWDPRPQEGSRLRPTPEHARELRRILVEALDRDLDPKGRNLASLSGGVDSSSVVALAAGTLGRGLSTWSFIPSIEPRRSHELEFIDPLVRELGVRQSYRAEAEFALLERWITDAPGLPFPVVNPALCELPRICAQQEIRVLTGGEFADEVGGQWARIGDWCRSTSLRELLAGGTRRLPFGRRDYLIWGKRRVLDLIGRPRIVSGDRIPAWVLPDVVDEYRDWLDRRRTAVAQDRRPLKELADRAAADGWVAMNWEGTSSLGIRRSLPFFNREVLELAFSCHPHELLGPGPKKLLREALREDVPWRNLGREDKGSWLHHWEETSVLPASTVAEGEPPRHAGQLARGDWIPMSPRGAPRDDILSLRTAFRVMRYLERHQANRPRLHPLG